MFFFRKKRVGPIPRLVWFGVWEDSRTSAGLAWENDRSALARGREWGGGEWGDRASTWMPKSHPQPKVREIITSTNNTVPRPAPAAANQTPQPLPLCTT